MGASAGQAGRMNHREVEQSCCEQQLDILRCQVATLIIVKRLEAASPLYEGSVNPVLGRSGFGCFATGSRGIRRWRAGPSRLRILLCFGRLQNLGIGHQFMSGLGS